MLQLLSITMNHLKAKIVNKYFFISSIVIAILSVAFSVTHYLNIFYGNSFSWIFWLLSVLMLFFSFISKASFKNFLGDFKKPDLLIAGFIIVLYFSTHLWNFNTAPWNHYGLFDDAAWDIFFAKNHAFNGPYQPAFFDTVGYISRETVFHYYITIFFKLFGYNLLVFNISLLFLGFITVFFTTFIVHRLFKNNLLTIITAFIINFFPFQYMHIFMGHRYAIAAPLMVISLYFLYQSFINKSLPRAVLSAFFAVLCWDSAIMGKQYILALFLTAFCYLFIGKKLWMKKENTSTILIWTLSFVFSAIPLLTYIAFNYNDYFLRERGLSQEFIALFKQGGINSIRPYFDGISELFFAEHSFKRQFIPDYPLIPYMYYPLLFGGFIVAFLKKRLELIFISFIPILSAFVSGSYDFRILLAVPAWVICMSFFLDETFRFGQKLKKLKYILFVPIFACLIFGLGSSIFYLWTVSRDPHHLWLLPHRDVAVSRIIQDIVVGSPNPTISMKFDELDRKVDLQSVSYDTLVCPYSAYAIIHVYLQNYDDKKVLSLCNQGIQLLKDEKEILNDNMQAILDYEIDNKDLKLIWEFSDKSINIIDMFKEYEKYGTGEELKGTIDGEVFTLYVLTIKKENIPVFKEKIKSQVYSSGFSSQN